MFSFFFSSLLIDRHEKNIWIAGALLCVCTGRCCLLIADDAATDLSTSRPPRASTLSYWLHISSSLIYQFSSSSSSSSKRTKKNGRTIRRKIKKTCLFFFFFKVHSSSSSGSNWWETRKGIWYKSLCPCSSTFGSQTNKHTHTQLTKRRRRRRRRSRREERETRGTNYLFDASPLQDYFLERRKSHFLSAVSHRYHGSSSSQRTRRRRHSNSWRLAAAAAAYLVELICHTGTHARRRHQHSRIRKDFFFIFGF